MDDQGVILQQGKCPNDELPYHPAFALKGRKRSVIEASGNWTYLYDLLEPLFERLMLAHPLRVRAIAAARVKTNAIDARTLTHLLRSDLIPAAYVPDAEVRELRELLRYRLIWSSNARLSRTGSMPFWPRTGWSLHSPTSSAARAGSGWPR